MKKQHVQLQDSERNYLKSLLSKGILNIRVQKRAIGLLELDKGKTYQEVADLFNMSYPGVHAWGKKYRTEGLAFLQDKPRSGRPVGLSGKQKAQITAIAFDEKNEIVLYPRVGDHKIILGVAGDFKNKFEKLKVFYRQGLGKVGWDRYSMINLKYHNQVVCTKR